MRLIVCSQSTKGVALAFRPNGDYVPDLDGVAGDDDAVDEQFQQLSLANEGVGRPLYEQDAPIVDRACELAARPERDIAEKGPDAESVAEFPLHGSNGLARCAYACEVGRVDEHGWIRKQHRVRCATRKSQPERLDQNVFTKPGTDLGKILRIQADICRLDAGPKRHAYRVGSGCVVEVPGPFVERLRQHGPDRLGAGQGRVCGIGKLNVQRGSHKTLPGFLFISR